MDIIIRPAVKEDYAGVKKLMVQSWQHHMNLRPDTYILPENFFDEKVYEQLLAEGYYSTTPFDRLIIIYNKKI